MKLISQLSLETGVPIPTIRFYEKSGLFKGKKKAEVRTNNYTYYDEEVVDKLELIRDAKSVGFSLSEIKSLIDAWYSKRLSKQRKMEILDNKIRQLNEKIKELNSIKHKINAFKAEVDAFDC